MSESRKSNFDVIVIGGGIGGVSLGYELANDREVCLFEAESTLAFHTTGRSAALYLETFGNSVIRALTHCSREFLNNPPPCFESRLVTPSPFLQFARPGRGSALREFFRNIGDSVPTARVIPTDEAHSLFPLFKPDSIDAAMYDSSSLEVDVHALHQGYVRGMRNRGAHIRTRKQVSAIIRRGTLWQVTTSDGATTSAPVIVNAAGAWVDQVAKIAGAAPIGIKPLLRTIFTVGAPDVGLRGELPNVSDFDDSFYLKPEGNQFLCSPADETLSEPRDASPDNLEIARALDEINETTTLNARHVRSSWAGLRSFVSDRTPVVGFDPNIDGFFWCAGQGGYGIQTCAALSRVGASIIRGHDLPVDVAATDLRLTDLDAGRPAIAGLTS